MRIASILEARGDNFGGGGHFRLGGEIPGFHDLCINLRFVCNYVRVLVFVHVYVCTYYNVPGSMVVSHGVRNPFGLPQSTQLQMGRGQGPGIFFRGAN